MAQMWRGPSAELKEANADLLWAAIHRRNGRLHISCDIDGSGREGTFYELRKQRGEWHRFDLGRVTGETPFIVALNGSHQFTPLDSELVALHAAYIGRLADEIDYQGHDLLKSIAGRADELTEVMSHVRT